MIPMRVSGGTYVRSLAHDIEHAVNSAAHVVTLTRSRQGRFMLPHDETMTTPALAPDANGSEMKEEGDDMRLCVPWDVLVRGLESGATEAPDVDGWREWEREVMERMEIVDPKS